MTKLSSNFLYSSHEGRSMLSLETWHGLPPDKLLKHPTKGSRQHRKGNTENQNKQTNKMNGYSNNFGLKNILYVRHKWNQNKMISLCENIHTSKDHKTMLKVLFMFTVQGNTTLSTWGFLSVIAGGSWFILSLCSEWGKDNDKALQWRENDL